MRFIKFVASAFLLAGCAGLQTQKGVDLPTPKDFYTQQFTYPVTGGPNEVRGMVLGRLNNLDLPYDPNIEGLNTPVVTSYVREVPSPQLKRQTVSAFLFTFTPTAIPTCTAVTLRWRVMSKGEFDAKWRVLEEDKAFRPSKLETIKRELEKEKCL